MHEGVYTCEVDHDLNGDPRVVANVTGDHIETLNNHDVLSLSIELQVWTRAPLNISYHFPNLEVYAMWSTGLEAIEREDLEGLTKLKEFAAPYNKLRTLSWDLFQNTPHLSAIGLSNNLISHIDHELFDNLTELTSLHVRKSPCIDKIASNDRTAVEALMFTLMISCPPTFKMIESRILIAFRKELDMQIVASLSPLMKNITDLSERVKALEEKHGEM